MKRGQYFANLFLILITPFLLNACKDGVTNSDISPTADEDAAESIAASTGYETGGSTDFMGDVSDIASNLGLQEFILGDKTSNQTFKAVSKQSIDKNFDQATQKWTVTLSRKKGSPEASNYTTISRVCQYQFLNAKNEPQKNYITDSDTAYAMTFIIVSGTNYHRTPRVSGVVTQLSGVFRATELNTSKITINGSFSKSGIDTINTRKGTRIINHTLNLTYTNIIGERGMGKEWYKTATGTVTGTYVGSIVTQKGTAYNEKSINKNIEITLGVGGKSDIKIGGKKFISKLLSGELEG